MKETLREMVVRIIKEEYGADSYSKSISDLWPEEIAAWKKMKGNDFQELATFFNKEKNTNIGKSWFTTDFPSFPSESKPTISKFLKMKKYL